MTALAIAASVAENDVTARHRLRVFRPDGSQVSSSEAGVRSIPLSTGAVFHVDAPEPGLWKVEVEGFGPFTATVRGNSDLAFSRFDFIDPNTDIHGGFHPLAGQPVTGRASFGEATLVGPATEAQFAFVDEQGARLQDVTLSREFPDANPEHFVGETGLPTVPFRLALQGVDASGHASRREYPTLYRTQQVELEIQGAKLLEASPGMQGRTGTCESSILEGWLTWRTLTATRFSSRSRRSCRTSRQVAQPTALVWAEPSSACEPNGMVPAMAGYTRSASAPQTAKAASVRDR